MRKRKRVKIKVSEIRRLSKLHVSEAEAAAYLGVTKKKFAEILQRDKKARRAWEEGRELGKLGLRRKQLRLADRSTSMAIFLGKQWLGQSDVSVTEISGRDGGPVEMDLSALSNDERKQLRAILTTARKKS